MERKPLPRELKELRGTRRPSEENKEAQEVELVKTLKCPEKLKDFPGAVEAWKWMVRMLAKRKPLSEIDRPDLECYCVAYSRWCESVKIIAKEGQTVTSSDGFLIRHPQLRTMNEMGDQLIRLLTKFGMTPASRSRV